MVLVVSGYTIQVIEVILCVFYSWGGSVHWVITSDYTNFNTSNGYNFNFFRKLITF